MKVVEMVLVRMMVQEISVMPLVEFYYSDHWILRLQKLMLKIQLNLLVLNLKESLLYVIEKPKIHLVLASLNLLRLLYVVYLILNHYFY